MCAAAAVGSAGAVETEALTDQLLPFARSAAYSPSNFVGFNEAIYRREGLRAFVSATTVYPKGGIGLQCGGINDTLFNLQPSAYPIGRFGRTVEGKRGAALRMSVASTENVSIETPARCEILAYPSDQTGLPHDTDFWFGVSFWLPDWALTNDEQLIAQWHQDDSRLAVNPFLAVVVKGDQMRVEVRHSLAELATRQNIQTRVVAVMKIESGRWFDLVFKARLAMPGSSESTITAWQDDRLILEHRGDVGYKLAPQAHAYAKAGIYKWLNGNPWDHRVSQRSVLLRSFVLIEDQSNALTVDEIRNILSGRKSLFTDAPAVNKPTQPRN